jgi:hypothetical protein
LNPPLVLRALRLGRTVLRVVRPRTPNARPARPQTALDIVLRNHQKGGNLLRQSLFPARSRPQPPVDCRHLSASVFMNEML